MAFTEIDLELQSQDLTLTKAKLKADFLAGGDLNLTNGANDATITGLKDGVNPQDAVTKAQLDSVVVPGGMTYKGQINAGAVGTTLDNASRGDFYYVSAAGTYLSIDFAIGDHMVVNQDITGSPVAGQVDKIDNTESSDILRDGDIVDDLLSTDATKVLSANQGSVIKGLIDGVQSELDDTQTGAGLATDGSYVTPSGSNYIDSSTTLASADALLDAQIKVNADAIANLPTDVYGEEPVISIGSPTLGALANIPATDVRVYWNGIRAREGAGNDYLVNLTTGVITMGANMKSKDIILVDYKY